MVNAIAVAVMAINMLALAIIAFSTSIRSAAGVAGGQADPADSNKD